MFSSCEKSHYDRDKACEMGLLLRADEVGVRCCYTVDLCVVFIVMNVHILPSFFLCSLHHTVIFYSVFSRAAY
jgi:hypothetical protein